MAYYVGKNAGLEIDGDVICMTDWALDVTSEEVDLTTFCSIGQAGTVVGEVKGVNTVVGGIIGGSMSASGPYTGIAPVAGQVVPVVFFLSTLPGGPSFTQTFLITSVRITQNVRDKAVIEVAGTLTALPTTL
jgi:hypothetical protein